MSVITATSPNSPDSFVVATSHHQNMPRASASSPSTSVNGLHYSAPATPAGPRRLGTNDAGHGNSAAASMSNGRKSKRSILDLATEQLVDILNYLEDDPQKSIGFDRRAYLSQESFRPPIPPSTTRATDLAHFRETCKKFAEVGASLQFERVSTRFSVADFERLDKIASQPHLACEVRKFSYLVPYFYVDGKLPPTIF